jgi:hypothetical protein
VIPSTAGAVLHAQVDSLHLRARSLAAKPTVAVEHLQAPRLGIYKSYAASIDEGWTRMVLDRHDFKYTSLENAAIQAKDLNKRFDVILVPDEDKNLIIDGKPKGEEGPAYFEPLPPAYSGGIGKEGVANLKSFVQEGGTLVCMSDACALAIDEFNLPVRNVVARVRSNDYALPGTMVNLKLDPSTPIAFGMPEECAAFYTNGPVFATSVPGAGVGRTVVARFPEYADQVVASGWAAGTQLMAGRAAVVEVTLGKGRVVLFGPRVQSRGQTLATYKLLFNAILQSSARP